MQGQMMHRDLRIIDILTHAAEAHGDQGIVSARVEGDIHRQSYGETLARVGRLANALEGLGVGRGDRVGTLAWNGYRHFELYYGVAGMGAVCHTINPRLSQEQLLYIIQHAGDRVLFLDLTFVPLVEALLPDLPDGLRFVLMTDRAHMPETVLDALCYEELLEGQPESHDWPEFPEETASGLCYTSGTTGNPKGALYSHRSTLLHAMQVPICQTSSFRAGQRILPVVPLFHVNAWGLPYTAPLTGMTLVMPGPHLDGPSLFRLMEAERVWSAWGVPTVWAGLLEEIRAQDRVPEGFGDLVVGGSAAPKVMIEAYEARGVNVAQAWGMTEMSPIGTHGILPSALEGAPEPERIAAKCCAGRRLFGVEFKIVDDDCTRMPHDGVASGELYVRGNTVISGYFENAEATAAAMDAEGWFGTGDVASVSPEGRLVIRDRAKDLVKSGGEWISSIDLENAALSHSAIAACAVIAVPHPKWDERPVLVAVAAGELLPDLAEVRAHMAVHFADWQLPDDLLWIEALPLTATGKVSKLTLREQFSDYVHPDLREAGA
ncbi:Long-chain-fatty-acid--CoA ligase [Roseovarius tolerans]|uniref:Long-chain-fatty-acid--CoA ligase n=1 Tax=Roseovarius tolerans TaxID=74031 RepID=A0A0L6CS44_9RHOB|nr:long-chain-fatty-acid--CoA ligase [Roseovarius tolerans]KNX40526.1 Long-chain-fatty-acid--CoA ligase [Roseovarius tolerans]